MKKLVCFVFLALIASTAHAQSLIPKINNPSFEEKEAGWGWGTMNGCRTWYRSETENPHSGKRCMVFVNESSHAPHVYGRFLQGVAVLPETEYELSVWVRGEDVKGDPAPSHFTDWNTYTLNLPSGTFGWTRVSTRFKTNPGQYSVNLGLNVVNTCKVLAIDDILLVPYGVPIKADGIEGSCLAPSKLIGHNSSGYLRVAVDSTLKTNAVLEVELTAVNRKLLAKQMRLKQGENTFEFPWNSGKVPFGSIDLTIRVKDTRGKVLVETGKKIEKVDSPLFESLAKVEERFHRQFMDLYRKCEERGISLDYPRVTKQLLEQFIQLTYLDIEKSQNWRADYAIKDFNQVLDESIARMEAYLANPKTAPNARRYQNSEAKIEGINIIAERKDTTGRKDRGPVYLVGYGHFGQLRRDLTRFPDYGINMIQFAEFGPSAVFPEEGKVSLEYPKILVKTLDEAAKNNIRVDFLISPHYFPNWALAKWPHLTRGGGGFLGFVPDEKEAKKIIEDFLRLVVPMIKDKPALNSFCLSNEPVLINTASASNTRAMWSAYLAKVHNNVKTMNDRYGTDYPSFDEVPVPGNNSYNDPQFYDWCMFNDERFAGWHKWMADIIHEMAPDKPVHAKTMSIWFNRDTVAWGCHPEMFGEMGQIAGNDCWFMGGAAPGWAAPWHAQNINYDLQRSVTGKPIYNSENHISPDRATWYIAPEHFRTALWQGMMHGQGITTIWAWERTFDAGSDLYGLVMDRPGCAHAVGVTSLDLNRFADEVSAIQNEKSPVAILFSTASQIRSSGYVNAVMQVYSALCFHGFKVDFITEKQLQSGKGAQYRLIVFPESSHVLQATFDAVRKLPESVKIAYFGECLTKDPYNHAFPADAVKALKDRALSFDANPNNELLWPEMHQILAQMNALPEVSVVDAYTGEPVWGLEWLPAKTGNRTVISLVNLRDKPVYVKFLSKGNRVQARDLLSLGGLSPVKTIKPITPVLAEVERQAVPEPACKKTSRETDADGSHTGSHQIKIADAGFM